METNLRFALLPQGARDMARSLAQLPLLLHCKAQHAQVHAIYFDTPDLQLQRDGLSLRLRKSDTGAAAQASSAWVQTLKMAHFGGRVPASRGKWEVLAHGGELDLAALSGTPWRAYDPQATVSAQLLPQFEVNFARSRWMVNLQASRVAIALDVGVLEAGGVRQSLCELTLDLQDGHCDAVFEVARQLSHDLSMLPMFASKAERGYLLAQQTPFAPARAAPISLTQHMTLAQVARATLQEMFLQFTVNLRYLQASDAPELLHQARIGWRRFKSALQLITKHPSLPLAPVGEALQPLWSAMAALRDLEVALAHTLPMFAHAYTGGDAQRRQQWQAMEQALADAVARQRAVMLAALEAPEVGTSLIDWMQWLIVQLSVEAADADLAAVDVSAWLHERLLRLHKQLMHEPANANDLEVQHRIRILSKRLRYGVEAFRPLLPKGRAKRWLQLATSLQENIGAVRDIACAVEMVAALNVDAGIVQFLRGVAFGQSMHTR